jgi:spore germination protein KB
MTDHLITGKQMQSLLTMFWLGTLILLGFNSKLNQDSWIGVLVATVLFLPLMFVYIRIIYLYPGQDFFDIILQIFGKVFGKILIFIMVFYAIHLAALVMKNFSEFITILNIQNTPECLIYLFLALLSILSVANGAENLGRLSRFAQPILIFVILITVLIGFKDFDFDNLKPIMVTDSNTMLTQSLIMATLPFGEIVVCLPFFGSLSSLANPLKIFLKGLAVSVVMLVIVNMRNILLLGIETAKIFYFPSYQAIGIISLGDFFTRIEVLIGLNMVLAGFIKICACVYTASLGVTKMLNFTNQKLVIVPCVLLIVTLAGLLYSNTIEMINFLPYYPYYAAIFQVLIPVIVLVGAEIKKRKKSPKTPGTNKSECGQARCSK